MVIHHENYDVSSDVALQLRYVQWRQRDEHDAAVPVKRDGERYDEARHPMIHPDFLLEVFDDLWQGDGAVGNTVTHHQALRSS